MAGCVRFSSTMQPIALPHTSLAVDYRSASRVVERHTPAQQRARLRAAFELGAVAMSLSDSLGKLWSLYVRVDAAVNDAFEQVRDAVVCA
jgi:hypothetical protein